MSISQPAYLPWLGYFHRIAVSDLHIVLDHVQIGTKSFTNRNRVMTTQGPLWLTVPVATSGSRAQLPIRELEIDASRPWCAKHWRTLEQSYRRAPYFSEHAPFLESVYRRSWTRIDELCAEVTGYLLSALGIHTSLRRSSEMRAEGAKDDLILDLCREAGARTYLSGVLGADYLREELFAPEGIAVVYQDYRHPVYPQGGRAAFEPYMSVIDLLFHCGPRSLDVLTAGQPPFRTRA